MPDPFEFIPGYISPLTDKEHAQIGRIAVLWGQIEYFVEVLMCFVSKQSWEELKAITVADKPIGAKVEYLNAARKRLDNEDLKAEIGALCTLIHDTKIPRNHVFHGIWGWRGDVRTKSVYPAARKTNQPRQPFKASQLSGLEKKLCKCSRMASELVNHFYGFGDVRGKFNRYFHHGGNDVPQWLEQWSARNPQDDDALDRSGKVGQLPRLARPLPRK